MLTKNCEPPIGNKTAYDRGAADSYYGRAMIPHMLIGFQQVLLEKGTQEWDEYMEGYDHNENIGNFKDWGTAPVQINYCTRLRGTLRAQRCKAMKRG